MQPTEEDVIALPRARAASLAGLTERQVDYWMRTDLVRPAVDTRVSRRPIRLYDYVDLMSLLVIAELLDRKISVRHIRRIVTYLRGQGYAKPLTEVRFAVHEKSVYIQHVDGSWEGDRQPGQLVMEQVLKLAPLRAKISSARKREPGTEGRVERRRGTLGYKDVFAGTRVPVETVRRYLEHGASIEDVLAAYPILSKDDVKTVMRAAG